MPKKSDIVSYSADELREMRRLGEDRTDWRKVDAMTEEELEASIAGDPDDVHEAPNWSQAISGLPPVDVAIDSDVLAWFRLAGDGYRTRINDVLRAHVKRQKAMRRRNR